jgi:hypothetical protein
MGNNWCAMTALIERPGKEDAEGSAAFKALTFSAENLNVIMKQN